MLSGVGNFVDCYANLSLLLETLNVVVLIGKFPS